MLKDVEIETGVKKRFPEAIAVIISKDKNGKVNLCPVGFFCLIAWEPKTWAIGLYNTHYSTKIINDTNEFTLSLPTIDQAKDILYCGSVHGWKIDKIKSISLKFVDSKYIKPPLIDDAVANFECQVIQKTNVEDHTVFFGKIVAAHESNKNWKDRIYNLDDTKVGTIKFGDKSVKITFSPEGE